jgi:hypothetical protein
VRVRVGVAVGLVMLVVGPVFGAIQSAAAESVPVITVGKAQSPNGVIGCGNKAISPGSIVLSRSGPVSDTLTVGYQETVTYLTVAQPPVTSSGTAVFASDAPTVQVSLDVPPVTTAIPHEVDFELLAGPGYVLGEPSGAQVPVYVGIAACPPPPPTTSTSATATTSTTVVVATTIGSSAAPPSVTAAGRTSQQVDTSPTQELPRTGSASGVLAGLAVMAIGSGLAFARSARVRRR